MNLDMGSEKYNEYMHLKHGDLLSRVTCGSPLNGQKIIWWKEERPELYNHICKFVTLNGYVAGKLAGVTGEEAFIDYTLLAFSGIDDARKLAWSKDLCECLNIDMNKLPAIVSPEKTIGGLGRDAALQCGLLEGTPIFAGVGDQAAGFLGAGLIQPGFFIDVSGSSTLLCLCVDTCIPDVNNRTVMYMPSVKRGTYHAFTYINGGGMSLNWFVDELCSENDEGLQSKYEEITERASQTPPGCGGLLFIPYLGGRQCPFDSHIRGGWIGLNWGHGKEYLFRSILESIAYDCRLGYKNLKRIFPNLKVDEILITGGGSRNDLWNQIKADVMGIEYIRVGTYEYNLRGCGIIGAYGSGVYDSIDSAVTAMKRTVREKRYSPVMENHRRYSHYFNIYEGMFRNNLQKTFHLLSEAS